ncbi:DUF6191 domain-containing protein [Nocardia sp. NPDC056100]|uniref:DUF6191 domain-containing protein n=1 Tax=Nocardia sp. NPDC056100 TaxID=3345712 RepID=UPI0035E1892A
MTVVWVIVGIVVFAIVLDRALVFAERRGWISSRSESTGGGGAGLFGELQALVAPSSQHTQEELRSREMRGEQLETSGDPLGVDLANGIVRLPSANPEPRQSDPPKG